MKVTAHLNAYITEDNNVTPEQLQTPEGISTLYFSPNPNMGAHGWTLVGEAVVTVDVPELKTLVENKVDALRAEAANVRATATKRCTEIEGMIQNLLAIEYTPQEPPCV